VACRAGRFHLRRFATTQGGPQLNPAGERHLLGTKSCDLGDSRRRPASPRSVARWR